jgi:hypothetical protein
MTVFADMVERVGQYFDEDCSRDRKYALENKKERYAKMKKRLHTAQILLASELLSPDDVEYWLRNVSTYKEITKDNAHKIRQLFGDITRRRKVQNCDRNQYVYCIGLHERIAAREEIIMTNEEG